jgi:hypothetical protein
MIGRLLVRAAPAALALAVTSVARADAPEAAGAASSDPAVREASDANLESTADRRGLTFAGTIGGGATIGFGIEDSVGRGGMVSLRLGHVATPRTLITFELQVTAALHRPATDSSVKTNTDVNLMTGAQYYVNRSLWLRLAGGIGSYQGRQVAVAGGKLGDVTLTGPVVLVGGGLDLLRLKWAVVGIEADTSAMINRDGVLVVSAASLGVQFD